MLTGEKFDKFDMTSTSTICGQWRLGRHLGSGGFGTVQVWIQVDTGRKLAIKKCKWEENQLNPVQKNRWSNEVIIMTRLNHPNIVKTETLPPELVPPGNSLPVLCMEYCSGGDLRSILNKAENCCGLEEQEALRVISHVTSAVEYLHCYNITHRDLKPENIVVQIMNDVVLYKLIDLGYAKELGEASTSASIVGTLNYVAPEILWKETYSCSVDYWSLGILFYEVLTGIRPFLPRMQHTMTWMQHIRSKDYNEICAYEREGSVIFGRDIRGPTHLSKCLQDKLVEWFRVVLQWDPKQRGRMKNADGTTDLVVFSLLESILTKRIIYVFSIKTYKLSSYEISRYTSVRNLQELIAQDIEIPVDQQILTNYNGSVFPTNEAFILQNNCHPVLFVFKSGSTLFESVPVSIMSVTVQKMLEQPKLHVDPETLKDYYRSSIFFLKQEKNLFRLYIFALSIKVDLIKEKIDVFHKNMTTPLVDLDALVNDMRNRQSQLLNSRELSETKRQDFEVTCKKINTLATAAEQIKIQLSSLREVYNGLRKTAEHNDFGSDLSGPYNEALLIYESHKKENSHKCAPPISMVKQIFKFLKIRDTLLRIDNNIGEIASKVDSLEEELIKLEESFKSVTAMTAIYAEELMDIAQTNITPVQCSASRPFPTASVSNLEERTDDTSSLIYDNIVIRHTLDSLIGEMVRNYKDMFSLDAE